MAHGAGPHSETLACEGFANERIATGTAVSNRFMGESPGSEAEESY